MENQGFRALLSSPSPNAAVIISGHSGIEFRIVQLKAEDDDGTTIFGFSSSVETMSLSKINSLNQSFGAAKVYLEDDNAAIGYRLFIKEEDLTEVIFRTHFIAWIRDVEILSRQIGR